MNTNETAAQQLARILEDAGDGLDSILGSLGLEQSDEIQNQIGTLLDWTAQASAKLESLCRERDELRQENAGLRERGKRIEAALRGAWETFHCYAHGERCGIQVCKAPRCLEFRELLKDAPAAEEGGARG